VQKLGFLMDRGCFVFSEKFELAVSLVVIVLWVMITCHLFFPLALPASASAALQLLAGAGF
jgi:hypothetical protein